MTRHLRLPLAILLGLAVVAAACGGGDDGGEGGGEGEASACPVDALEEWDPAADGKVEVTVWHSYVAETRDTLIAMAEDYNASQDKVEVRIESQGNSYDELLRKYTQAIPTADLPGIAILEDTVTQFMADSGTVVPGQACFEASGISLDEFLPIAVDYYTVDGSFMPGSLNLSTIVLYFNKDHFRQAGLDPEDPPQTLDELRSAAQAIEDASIPGIEDPLVMILQPWFVEQWLTGAGAAVVDNDNGRGEDGATAGAFDNDSAREVFSWIEGMQADGLLNGVSGTEGRFEHYFAVGLQQSSMTMETSTAVTTIDAFLEGELDPSQFDIDLEELPPIDLDIGVAAFPGLEEAGKGQLGGGAWYIPDTNSDEVIAGAWDFIRWMNEPAQQVRWNLEGSYLPWNLAAAEDPELRAAWSDTRKGRWLAIAYESLLNSDPDWPGPLIGPYDRTREAIRDGLDSVIFGGTGVDQAVTQTNDAITAAVERYAEENF